MKQNWFERLANALPSKRPRRWYTRRKARRWQYQARTRQASTARLASFYTQWAQEIEASAIGAPVSLEQQREKEVK